MELSGCATELRFACLRITTLAKCYQECVFGVEKISFHF
jgi:hypothetical protein